MKKVTFQHEIDVTEFCTDELRKKLVPVRDKIREVRKEEEDVERAKKRQKRVKAQEEIEAKESKVRADEPMQKLKEKAKGTGSEGEKAANGDSAKQGAEEEKHKTDDELEKERADKLASMKQDVLSAVHDDLKKDPTANQTGLYELRALVTHQGSSA
ncbi:deubiquitinating enzyme, partial [Friedmanniomyces endolithicus]